MCLGRLIGFVISRNSSIYDWNRPYRLAMTLRMNAEEIAAALVEASIGYFTARVALAVAERYLAGETADFSERCLACFGGDLRKMVETDLRYWRSLSEERKAQARLVVGKTKDWNWVEAATLSMLYPTTGGP